MLIEFTVVAVVVVVIVKVERVVVLSLLKPERFTGISWGASITLCIIYTSITSTVLYINSPVQFCSHDRNWQLEKTRKCKQHPTVKSLQLLFTCYSRSIIRMIDSTGPTCWY